MIESFIRLSLYKYLFRGVYFWVQECVVAKNVVYFFLITWACCLNSYCLHTICIYFGKRICCPTLCGLPRKLSICFEIMTFVQRYVLQKVNYTLCGVIRNNNNNNGRRQGLRKKKCSTEGRTHSCAPLRISTTLSWGENKTMHNE